MRHNQLRDTTADLLREVSNDVSVEPRLQPLTGEYFPPSTNTEDDARLDIRAKGFWDNQQQDTFDVRVFIPFAPSYRESTLAANYRRHEQQKRREYGLRVREVDRGYFTPLVFTTGGGMAPEATVFFKRLASMIAEKRGESYSSTMGWLRCVIGFCLLRASLTFIRSSRSMTGDQAATESNTAKATAMGRFSKSH